MESNQSYTMISSQKCKFMYDLLQWKYFFKKILFKTFQFLLVAHQNCQIMTIQTAGQSTDFVLENKFVFMSNR